MFNAGIKPAVNPGISVSRVGGSAQIKATKQVAGSLRLELANYWEIEAFSKFGSDLDAATQQQLRRGERLIEILKQDQFNPLRIAEQVAITYAAINGHLDDLDKSKVRAFEKDLFDTIRTQKPTLFDTIETERN